MILLSLQNKRSLVAFFLVIIASSTVLPFLSFLSSFYIILLVLLFFYSLLSARGNINILLFILIVAASFSIILGHAPVFFKSWSRLGLFIIAIGIFGGLLQSRHLYEIRKRAFAMSLLVCIFIGVGSFIGYFLGINFMKSVSVLSTGVGTFGGLTSHSMILGPMASVGCCALFWWILTNRTKKSVQRLILLSLFALFACVLLSSSRSAFISLIAGCLVILFQLKRNSLGKLLKSFCILGFVLMLLSPVLVPLSSNLLEKQKGNVEDGGTTASRDSKWQNRWSEFKDSPFIGIGFASVDINHKEDFVQSTGVIELGSSWLGILSMTGIMGFSLFAMLFIREYWKLYKRRKSALSALFLGLLTFFAVHMVAEGYAFAAGGYLFFLLWLTIGAADAFLRTGDEGLELLLNKL